MKKKVLYGVIMACFALLTMGTLQSCTDDLDTWKHEYASDQYKLDGVINELKSKIESCQTECATKIANLQSQISSNDADIEDIKELLAQKASQAEMDSLKKYLIKLEKDLKDKDKTLEDSIKSVNSRINTEINNVNTRIDNLKEEYQLKLDTINNTLAGIAGRMEKMDTTIQNLQNDMAGALTRISANETAISAMKGALKDLEGKVNANTANIDSLANVLDALQAKYDAEFDKLNTAVDQAFTEIRETQDMVSMVYNYLDGKIDSEVARLQEQIDAINTTLDSLQEQIDVLKNTVNDLITSILVQGTDNPIFGNFSLPIGVQSNLLFNWYFENLGESFDFPSATPEFDYAAKGDKSKMIVTAQEIADAIAGKGSKYYNVPKGNEDVELGKLYLTLNPVGHNLTDGKEFWLETSKGVEGRLPFELKLTPSNDELYFGYTRGIENGFYESTVTIPGATDPSAIAAARIVVDQNLKEAAKALLNDQTKRNAYNMLKAVYDQINGSFKSYAVRANWMDADKASRASYSVLSKYDLAVATAKPISFSFLEGKTINHRLRTFGHIDNFLNELIDKDKFKFKLNTEFKIDKFTITFDDLTFDFSIDPKVEFDQNIVVKVKTEDKEVDVELDDAYGGKVTGTVTIPGQEVEAVITPGDLQPLTDAITSAFKDAIKDMSLDLGNQINDQIREKLIKGIQDQVNKMLDDIQKQINDMLSDLESQINGQISDMIDDITGSINSKAQPWFDRLNKLVDIYNRVANKINNMLEDPNAYLQPVVYYQTNGRVHIVSMSKKDPTILVNAGGNAFTVYPTTYTAEILVPVYKKFVACTNVYGADGNPVADAKSQADLVNQKSPRLAMVLDARSYRIPITVKNVLKAGNTYEFVYQALDYSGKTSTKKFYIKVK